MSNMMENLIFQSSADDYQDAKQLILNAIEQSGKYGIVDTTQSLSNTDWHLSNPEKAYWQYAASFVQAHNNKLVGNFRLNSAQVQNFWFQQYERGDYHKWHNHAGCCFSSVFYVELGEASSSTTFRWMGESFEIPVKEGDIISFPSFLAHGSKPNKGTRKTIISYNTTVLVTE